MKEFQNKANDFKLKIIRQIKDSSSALTDLVVASAKREHGDRAELFASEFNILIKLSRHEVPFPKPTSPFFRYLCGEAYSLVFNDDVIDFNYAFDLSDKDISKHFEFGEEVIIPSQTNPNALTFGVRSFRVTHEDYEFKRVYHEGVISSIDFDLTALTFLGDIQQKLDEWYEDLNEIYPENEMSFIEYYLDEGRKTELEKYFKSCNLNNETQDMLFDFLSKECEISGIDTRLGDVVRNIMAKIPQ